MAWLSQVHQEDMWTSAVTIQEIRFGAETMDAGRRRSEIEAWLNDDLLITFASKILPVDAAVADQCGRMIAAAKKAKHNPDLADALIAATAVVHGLKIATLNRKDFEKLGVKLVTFKS
jgi:predicted nucleic acid-binding protein